MIYLKQGDLRWGDVFMGKSREQLKRSGCLTTDISMITSYFNCYLDPGQLAKILNYSSRGILQWPSVGQKTCIHLEKNYFHTYNEAKILEGINDLTKASILEINNGWHFVLAIKKIPGIKHYWIIDPINGTKTTTLRVKYNVTGSRLMSI